MEDISTLTLVITLVVLIFCSAFFSGSETGMMSINRYRLKHQTREGNSGAKRVTRLLERPDRLIGLILIGNNFVNILASAIATIIAVRLWGAIGIAIATGGLTIVVLLFAEVTPKTLAALYPEKVAFPASIILRPLLKLLYPLVFLVNALSNNLLKLLGIQVDTGGSDHLSTEELRTVVNEAGAMIPRKHQKMLLSILDLENVTVDDIMVPRNEIAGIDITDSVDEILDVIRNSVHTRLLIYEDDIDQVRGFLHARNFGRVLEPDQPSLAVLMGLLDPIYYVPEGTPLNTQLAKFQQKKDRIGLVVDEYGDIQGLVSLDDILEEIVGEFTTDYAAASKDVHPQEDNSFLVEGSATIRDLNRHMHWRLPTDGPKTLNGLITEYLETIPQAGTGLRLSGYPMEIIHVKDNMIKSVKIWPGLYKPPYPPDPVGS